MGKLIIGNHTYKRPRIDGGLTDVFIGNYSSLADGVTIDAGWQHRMEFVTTSPLDLFFGPMGGCGCTQKSKGDVLIGNDVWIGNGVYIMSGVTIGDGAVVGARAVVTSDVAPYEVVVGAPARHLRFRFSAEQIKGLLKIQWWNWPDEKVAQNAALLLSPDIQRFIDAFLSQQKEVIP